MLAFYYSDPKKYDKKEEGHGRMEEAEKKAG